MELMQFRFPDFKGFEDYVYTFESEQRLTRDDGCFVDIDKWVGLTPYIHHDGAGIPGIRVSGGGEKAEKSGGSVDYYQVLIQNPTTEGRAQYTAECNDIIEALGMDYAEGNAFKAIWRSCAERTLGKKKAGGNAVYDAEKMVFFSKRTLIKRKGATCN